MIYISCRFCLPVQMQRLSGSWGETWVCFFHLMRIKSGLNRGWFSRGTPRVWFSLPPEARGRRCDHENDRGAPPCLPEDGRLEAAKRLFSMRMQKETAQLYYSLQGNTAVFYYGHMNELNHPQSKRVGLKRLALISRTAERGSDRPIHFLTVGGTNSFPRSASIYHPSQISQVNKTPSAHFIKHETTNRLHHILIKMQYVLPPKQKQVRACTMHFTLQLKLQKMTRALALHWNALLYSYSFIHT